MSYQRRANTGVAKHNTPVPMAALDGLLRFINVKPLLCDGNQHAPRILT